MKNMITKTVMAAGVVAVMGATLAVASNGSADEAGAFVTKANFSTNEMMTSLNADNGAGIFGGVKAVLSPVKDYVMNTAFETTSCIIRFNFR
jgi:hypothetical protein